MKNLAVLDHLVLAVSYMDTADEYLGDDDWSFAWCDARMADYSLTNAEVTDASLGCISPRIRDARNRLDEIYAEIRAREQLNLPIKDRR